MMDKSPQIINERNTGARPNVVHLDSNYSPKTKQMSFYYNANHSIRILIICLGFFLIFQIPSLRTSSPKPAITTKDIESMAVKLRDSVTFLPLKDLRFVKTAPQGHTWFMSSMDDIHEEGEVIHQKFPSEASKGRILCIKGHDSHDGSWNYYGLAWPEALPHNATLIKGLTFVSYNHYNYENIWHGISALFPFVAWHIKSGCRVPSRWVLYHWGELRAGMNLWLRLLMEATFGGPVNIELFEGIEEDRPVCFEDAVVMRHNEGGMSRQRRVEAYDLMRCKARAFCNITQKDRNANEIGMTLLMRTGPRSFKNESATIDTFKSECDKVNECRFRATHANNLTFCQQVELMSVTDVLISSHGAQITNMFLMDRNSSLMEFFPKGWKKLAGVGQLVFRWLASWSGMKHQGYYHDLDGDQCPFPEDDRRCMSTFKNGRIGHNETYFRDWAKNVLIDQVKIRKLEEASNNSSSRSTGCVCA